MYGYPRVPSINSSSKTSSLLKARLNSSSRRRAASTGKTSTKIESDTGESKRTEDIAISTTDEALLVLPTSTTVAAIVGQSRPAESSTKPRQEDEEELQNYETSNSNTTPKYESHFVHPQEQITSPSLLQLQQQQQKDSIEVVTALLSAHDNGNIPNSDTSRKAWADDTPLQKIKSLLSTVPVSSRASALSTTSTSRPPNQTITSSSDVAATSLYNNNNHNKKKSSDPAYSFSNSAKNDTKTKPSGHVSPFSSSSSSANSPSSSSTPHISNQSTHKIPKQFNELKQSLTYDDDDWDWMSAEVDSTCVPYNSYIQIQSGTTNMANTIACSIVINPSSNDEVTTSEKYSGDYPERPGSAAAAEMTTASATGATTGINHRNKRNVMKYEAQADEPNNMTSTHGIHPSSLLIVYVKTISSSLHRNKQESSPNYYYPPHKPLQKTATPKVLRYGDIIALHSPLARNRALGVRQVVSNNVYASSGPSTATEVTNDISQNYHHEVGFFRSILGEKEKWLVVSQRDSIRIGSNVRDVEGILFHQTSLHCMGLPVRSNGHPVVLLNVATGGVLSLLQYDKATKSILLNIHTHGRGLHNVFSASDEEEEGHNSSWIVKQVGAPSCPLWNNQRMFLLETYLLRSERHLATIENDLHSTHHYTLKDFPIHVQEQIMMKELLGAMMGLEGRYIKFTTPSSSKRGHEYIFDCKFTLTSSATTQGVDPSLINIVRRTLPLCSDFVSVNEFIATRMAKFEYGLVAQALVSEVSALLQDYLSFTCQLEQQLYQSKLTISKLWHLIQPFLSAIRTLRQLVREARYYKGGQLLTQLNNMISSELTGDSRAEDISQRVLEVASRPFMDMLISWISKGEVYDPFNEFMIENKYPFQFQSSTSVSNSSRVSALSSMNSSVWEDCFCLRPQHIYLINDHTAEKVLTIGKYLNVIRECSNAGGEVRAVESSALPHFDSARECITVTEQINDVFNVVASTVLHLMLSEYNFVDNLRFVKKHFLIEQGDFFVQFLDMAEKELLSPVTKISKSRIHTLLLLSIQHGNYSNEANSKTMLLDELICEFSRDNLIDRLDAIHKSSGGIISGLNLKTPSNSLKSTGHQAELKGIDTFTLDCKISWPLSLIFTHPSMQLYKLLFRHLFFCKYVERRLFATWLDHQMLKEFDLRALLGKTYMLRQKMLHFMQNLVYYMMFEVIEPHWHKLMENIANVKTVDDLARIHNLFQASISQECLLTNIALLRILAKLMTSCLGFADHVRLFMKKAGIEESFSYAAIEYRSNRWDTQSRSGRSSSNKSKKKTWAKRCTSQASSDAA